MNYVANRAIPKMPNSADIQKALEGLWSASAVPGTEATASKFPCTCNPGIDLPTNVTHLKDHIFQKAIKDFLDAYTFNVKQVMKYCVGILAGRTDNTVLYLQLSGISGGNSRPANVGARQDQD